MASCSSPLAGSGGRQRWTGHQAQAKARTPVEGQALPAGHNAFVYVYRGTVKVGDAVEVTYVEAPDGSLIHEWKKI